jgi:urease accessory protein
MNLACGLALTRLLQLASPTLPVGAYSYSQGLEAAIESRDIRDADSARRWIEDVLHFAVVRFEAPLWYRLLHSWQHDEFGEVAHWNQRAIASRETFELRAETLQMGYSLRRLLLDLGDLGGFASEPRAALLQLDEVCFPSAFTFAVAQWRIPAEQALLGYLWSWLENQVMAAIKAVPLGQTDGQRMLLQLASLLPALLPSIHALADTELCNFTPGLAIASSQHETQYSRLFRS